MMRVSPGAPVAAIVLLALSGAGIPGQIHAPGAPAALLAQEASDTAAVSAVLDDFHDAASAADFQRYFGHFAPGAVFLGTDATERWTLDEFRDFARPYFEAGRGWTYVATERHVDLSPDGRTAWFDELLDNESLGVTRGTGVLVRLDGAWKVAQYHLAIPIPNAIAGEVVEMIRELPEEP